MGPGDIHLKDFICKHKFGQGRSLALVIMGKDYCGYRFLVHTCFSCTLVFRAHLFFVHTSCQPGIIEPYETTGAADLSTDWDEAELPADDTPGAV